MNNKNTAKTKKKKNAGFKTALVLIAAVLIWILVSIYVTKTTTWDDVYSAFGLESGPGVTSSDGFNDVSATVLYVGQGDCIFIKAGDTNILIDAGVWDSYPYINDFLKASGVKNIDYFFVTHPHTDHIGSFTKVLADYTVGEIIIDRFAPELTPTNSTYDEFLKAIGKSSALVREADKGETISFDKGQMTVISDGMYSDLNNSSLVLHFEYGETSFLFTGDCEYETEDDLLAQGLIPRCDVLKAGHHGTKDATSMDFLNAIKPAYVVVSCGINNEYGYPKDKFMSRVERAHAELYRTDEDGNITFLTDGQTIEIVTDSKRASGQ